MGSKYNDKRLPLSRRRKSMKKGWFKRRQMLKLLNKTQSENAQHAEDAENAENATNIQLFIADGILHDFTQVKEERADDYEEPIEAYEEENICNGSIEYSKDEDNLVMDNEEKVEIYEEYIEIYEEEGNTYNENIKKCEEEDLIIDNKEDFIIDNKEDLIIDNNCLSNRINDIPKNIPESRYIVDISFMWNEMHRIFDDHAQKAECQFKYWQLVNFHRRGLLTQLCFKCQICKQEVSLWTEPGFGTMDSEKGINAAAAAGCLEIGIGYTDMKNLLAAMNIKYMSASTYGQYRNNLGIKRQF